MSAQITTPRTNGRPVRRNKRRRERSAEPIIRADHLTKRYGAVTAVDDVSFEVRRGEIYGFLGPNGSGKSTTIGMLLGLVAPSSGSIGLFGKSLDERDETLPRVGAIIESPAFYPYLSGRRNLRVLADLRPGVTDKRIDEVIEIVGLSGAANRKYSEYSLGMKQRLGIGWTLLHDPELLVLDEPTNGLDPAGMAEVRHLILQLASEGKTIFISSHLLNEIEQVCDRVTIIQRGKLIAEGWVDEMVNSEPRLLVRVDAPERAEDIVRGLLQGADIVIDDNELMISAEGLRPAEINAALVTAGIGVEELHTIQHSLEEAFLDLTNNAEQEVPA